MTWRQRHEEGRIPDCIFFSIGEPNPCGQFFVGQSYLAPVSTEQVPVFNVTLEPGCRNNWHIHHAKQGGGQMLICTGGATKRAAERLASAGNWLKGARHSAAFLKTS